MSEGLWRAKMKRGIERGGFVFLYAAGASDEYLERLSGYVAFLRECGFIVKEVLDGPESVFMYRVRVSL